MNERNSLLWIVWLFVSMGDSLVSFLIRLMIISVNVTVTILYFLEDWRHRIINDHICARIDIKIILFIPLIHDSLLVLGLRSNPSLCTWILFEINLNCCCSCPREIIIHCLWTQTWRIQTLFWVWATLQAWLFRLRTIWWLDVFLPFEIF